MANIQVRIPEDELRALDALAAQLRVSRSDAARNALAEGLQSLRMERAWQRYARGDWSLERAANEAKVSLARMAEGASARGIPYFRESAAALDRSVEVARGRLTRTRPRGRPKDPA